MESVDPRALCILFPGPKLLCLSCSPSARKTLQQVVTVRLRSREKECPEIDVDPIGDHRCQQFRGNFGSKDFIVSLASLPRIYLLVQSRISSEPD